MTEGHEFLYEFGPYTLDGRERVLMREGRPVPLAPKALETLLVLIRSSGHIVEKDQLMSEVWPSTYVEEANLTQNISILRKVLSDGSNGSRYIETVPRRGYRFMIAVRKTSEDAASRTASKNSENFDAQRVKAYRFLAVLPFANASADGEMEYLSDGITESIINSLSQLPQLRVMSRNAVFRYKGREVDAQRIGRELGVDAVLVGRVHLVDNRLLISTELVDVANGWQLWGDNYDRGSKAIFDVQDEIAKQISATLRLRLTGEDEQRLTKRYTESAEAYQAYLQGRYHWSTFTRNGLEQATTFFRQAIELDPNYALSYAGIVDCYLRLATNYIPPVEISLETPPSKERGAQVAASTEAEALEPVKMRYKWDWTGVERELKRATELKSSYPAAHQWHAAYLFSLNLFREELADDAKNEKSHGIPNLKQRSDFEPLVSQIQTANPTPAEEIQVFCTVAREQMEAGNYEGACRMLKNWWSLGDRPKVEGLSSYSAGDLFFTAGSLTGWIASARQIPAGQKHAEALLNCSIGIFEHLGARTRSCEAQIELGYCYYREGFFDLARITMTNALGVLPHDEFELRGLALIRLAIVDRQAGRFDDSVKRLQQTAAIVELVGPWISGRYHQELATTLKDLGTDDTLNQHRDEAQEHYRKALYEFKAVGNHRYAAVVENNHGYLLLALGDLESAAAHLSQARSLFDGFRDKVCCAHVDESLARLYLAANQFDDAATVIAQAVRNLEAGGHEAFLAEILTTQGMILCRLGRHREAKRVLERANQLAERCGDTDGAGRALLVLVEEMCDMLGIDEKAEAAAQLHKLLEGSQHAATLERLRRSLQRVTGKKEP